MVQVPLPFAFRGVRCRGRGPRSSRGGKHGQEDDLPDQPREFRQGAKAVEITIAGQRMDVPVKFFQTGSLGWYLNGKTTITVDGQPVPVQIGLNLTIVGSKELPQDPAAPAQQPAQAPAASGDTD